MQKLSWLVAIGLLVTACQSEPPDPVEESQVSQGLSLGSSLGLVVASDNTCGDNNGITPTCAPSNASDVSHTWTAPSTGTFTFAIQNANFDNVLQIAPFGSPFAPLACNSSGTTSSLSLALTAGEQLLITIDGYAALCGSYQLFISKQCTSGCTPPHNSCDFSPGTCNVDGTCSFTSMCDASEVCRAGSCIAHCLVDPHFPC